jgi:transaldolase
VSTLHALHDAGQSIWLDNIVRSMLRDGELARRVRDDALTGVTSNPTIFQKALAGSADYDQQIAAARGLPPSEIFELLATTDVRDACDILAGVYRDTDGRDGFVSIEVSPRVSHDTVAMVAEAERLWHAVARPNLLVKVPGTAAGAEAVRRLVASGVNVNITLLFSLEAHLQVLRAYMAGLEERLRAGLPLSPVASVASFFVSRVDTKVDERVPLGLRGRAAIANAKLAYAQFSRELETARWRALAAKGARPQRPLWASTSTKNPTYRDVLYVEELIAPETVNTMTPATIEAFREHGRVRRTADLGLDEARATLGELERAGVSMREVGTELLHEGIASFGRSYSLLLQQIESKAASAGERESPAPM